MHKAQSFEHIIGKNIWLFLPLFWFVKRSISYQNHRYGRRITDIVSHGVELDYKIMINVWLACGLKKKKLEHVTI